MKIVKGIFYFIYLFNYSFIYLFLEKAGFEIFFSPC